MKQTTYHQEDIRPVLIKYLTAANHKIHLAIGWLNDVGLEGLLQKKALEGLEVSLILIKDQDHQSKSNALKELVKKGVRIIALDTDKKEHLIDHKFGVIDDTIVLTGNYAWGHKIAPKEDSLSITEGVPTLVEGFEMEFTHLSISKQLPANEPKPSNSTIALLKRMAIIKTFLGMGDTEFIDHHYQELEAYLSDTNVKLIYDHLVNENFDEAHDLIKIFVLYHQALRECIEPPIDNLRREIQFLEEEIAGISNEYSETQKQIHKFSKMHTDTLGELLQKLLYQSEIKANIEANLDKEDDEKQEEFEEAKSDHEEYNKSYEIAKKQKLAVLTKEEQKELKKLYRKTSLKCHPDRVVEELHDQAEEIFVQLNEAYKANDLERVREISEQLKPGIMLSKSEGITELKKLESTYKSLLQKLEGWQEKLNQLQADPSYKAVSSIEDWESYFNEKKEILQQQLDRLLEFNKSNVEFVSLDK